MTEPSRPPTDHEAQYPDNHTAAASPPGFLSSRTGLIAIALLAVAGLFLIVEHQAHILEWLPWLFVIACPLMHVFMHGRHGGHGDHGRHSGGEAGPSRARPALNPELRK